jgi:transposase
MIQRGGQIAIGMLSGVKQRTIGPLIKRTVTPGAVVYTDEYDIYARLVSV